MPLHMALAPQHAGQTQQTFFAGTIVLGPYIQGFQLKLRVPCAHKACLTQALTLLKGIYTIKMRPACPCRSLARDTGYTGRALKCGDTCRVTAARFVKAADANVLSRDTHLLVEGDLLQEAQGLL
jgi:hypothetical protein